MYVSESVRLNEMFMSMSSHRGQHFESRLISSEETMRYASKSIFINHIQPYNNTSIIQKDPNAIHA